MRENMPTVQTQTAPPNAARSSGPTVSGGVTGGAHYSPVTADLGQTLDPGGMRGIGLVVFMIAQIALKLETVELSKDYYRTNKKDFDWFKATHQPGMAASVLEAMSEISNPDYTTDLYASSPAGMGKSKLLDAKWFATRRRMNRYLTGAQKRVDYDFAIFRSAAIASGWNMGRRYEMTWTDAHNERAFNKKIAMANIGVAAGNTMRQGLATAVANMQNAYSNIGSSINSVANGLYEKEGYENGRNGTRARYGAMTENQND